MENDDPHYVEGEYSTSEMTLPSFIGKQNNERNTQLNRESSEVGDRFSGMRASNNSVLISNPKERKLSASVMISSNNNPLPKSEKE